MMRLNSTDKLSIVNEFIHPYLQVNGYPFIVEYPNEKIWDVEENKLVTLYKGCLYNYWNPEEIEGRFIE